MSSAALSNKDHTLRFGVLTSAQGLAALAPPPLLSLLLSTQSQPHLNFNPGF